MGQRIGSIKMVGKGVGEGYVKLLMWEVQFMVAEEDVRK